MTEEKTVLVVEDEKNIVDILRFNLERKGYRVIEAYDGEEGLRMARTEKPDLILLDIMLPKMIGFDVCGALRKANIRRTSMASPAGAAAADSAMPVAGDLAINTDSHQVFRAGKAIDLTQREYELLTFLASHPNKVYSRVDLMEQVWNYGYVGDDVRTVDVTVRRLREKIEENPASPQYILTRRGAGYYFAVN